MKGEREPKYICLNVQSLRAAMRLKPREKTKFFDGIFKLFENISKNENDFDFSPDIVGELLRSAEETMVDGYNAYMSRVRANPEGRNGTERRGPEPGQEGGTMTSQRPDIDRNQSNQSNQMNQTIINQIRIKLRGKGYTDTEIDEILKRTELNNIRDLESYISKAIDRERSEKLKREYEQRNYQSSPDEKAEDFNSKMALIDQLTNGGNS